MEMSRTQKLLIFLGLLWAAFAVSQSGGNRLASEAPSTSSTPTPLSIAKPVIPSVAEQSQVSQCYDKGSNIATAYFVNIKQATNIEALASEMMETGCSQSAGAAGPSCVDECRHGFKAKAKQWVKDGSL